MQLALSLQSTFKEQYTAMETIMHIISTYVAEGEKLSVRLGLP